MELWVVDAFTTTPFKGNPAAVAIVNEFPSEKDMLSIAAEMNLSETCFVKVIKDERYHIRWFTPTVEVKLCGHATLAAAFVLKTCLKVTHPHLIFESLSGDLHVDVSEDRITMDFPSAECHEIPIDPAISHALGNIAVEAASTGPDADSFLIYAYASQSDIEALTPNSSALTEATPNAVIVTAPGDSDYDYALRVFAPQYGISEDPVTGSAQVLLANFWKSRLNKPTFKATQASKRTGDLYVQHLGDTISIAGNAVLVSKVTFL
ncbi:PhzF family phenazine biosynthesis isomerase [bacterium]|jgi:PhzF family phenazine biosynthesis protein|nr:PhzF family phenazine biosynthesis isomerase [bacterium]